jgi:hypothetical protein
MISNVKTIKSISTKTYDLALVELPDGQYCIVHGRPYGGEFTYREPIKAYNVAAILFDMKLEELEGY